VERPDWSLILPAFARCVRITRDQKQVFPVAEKRFVEKEEKDLYKALQKAEAQPRAPGSVDDFLNAFLPMIPAVNAFFEKVLVMADDPGLKENRLGLLQRIAALSGGAADLARLEGF
jgi:glycyl-tRNA synthetase